MHFSEKAIAQDKCRPLVTKMLAYASSSSPNSISEIGIECHAVEKKQNLTTEFGSTNVTSETGCICHRQAM